jgi:hypothetical protein
VAKERLEGDGDDRGAERCSGLLGDAGVHRGVRDAGGLDVGVGDGHRRDQHRPDAQLFLPLVRYHDNGPDHSPV